MPRIPYMSPAAIGCSVVRLCGWPSRAKRLPSAASSLSGQPSPLDELTVTTSPSRTSCAARSAETTLFMRGFEGSLVFDVNAAAAPGRFQHRQRSGERSDAVFSSGGGCPFSVHGGNELVQRPRIEIFVHDRDVRLAPGVAQRDLADWALGHYISGDDR